MISLLKILPAIKFKIILEIKHQILFKKVTLHKF